MLEVEISKICFIANKKPINEMLLLGSLDTADLLPAFEVKRHALEQELEVPVSAVYMHPANNPVVTEIVTADALGLKHPNTPLLRVAIWQAHQLAWLPDFTPGQALQKADFSLVGTLVLPDSEEALNQAFKSSNNLDHSWNPLLPCRSSSVGDVFVVTSANGESSSSVVATIGFVDISFE
jgi:hypothetical protein